MAEDTNKIMHVAPPAASTIGGSGALVHGISIQGGMEQATRATAVDMRKGIQGLIRDTTAALKKAQADVVLRTEDRSRLYGALSVPPDLRSDLEPIAVAMRKFEPGAVVNGVATSISPQWTTNQFSATIAITSGSGTRSLFSASRTWDMGPAIQAASEELAAAEAKVTALNGDLGMLRQELADLPARVQEIEAAAIRSTLGNDTEGKKIMDAMDRVGTSVVDDVKSRLSTHSRKGGQ